MVSLGTYLLRSQWQSQLHPLWHFILLQSEHILLCQMDAEFMIL